MILGIVMVRIIGTAGASASAMERETERRGIDRDAGTAIAEKEEDGIVDTVLCRGPGLRYVICEVSYTGQVRFSGGEELGRKSWILGRAEAMMDRVGGTHSSAKARS